jgi:hypothetical protein
VSHDKKKDVQIVEKIFCDLIDSPSLSATCLKPQMVSLRNVNSFSRFFEGKSSKQFFPTGSHYSFTVRSCAIPLKLFFSRNIFVYSPLLLFGFFNPFVICPSFEMNLNIPVIIVSNDAFRILYKVIKFLHFFVSFLVHKIKFYSPFFGSSTHLYLIAYHSQYFHQ